MYDLRQELVDDEGLRLKPYRCTSGKWTIGVGHNYEDKPFTTEQLTLILNEGFTSEVAMQILDDDIIDATEDLFRAFPDLQSLDEVRKGVLINMCFQMGIARLSGFKKMIEALRNDDYKKAADEMLDSNWRRQTPNRALKLHKFMLTG